jgi:misacylated tRNA(Ala) deacylase
MKEYANLRMHSAEHILNQTMVRLFKCDRCFRAHIEKKKSKCDYHFDRPLTDEEIHDIESKVNQVIDSNLPVREEFLTREEAQARETAALWFWGIIFWILVGATCR